MSSDTSMVFNLLARDRATEVVRSTAKKVAAAAAVAGAAGGAALAAGMVGNLEGEAANDKVAASLGLTPAQQKVTGAAASKVFAGAYAGNMSEASAAVGTVVSSIKGLKGASADTVASTTADALNFAKTFDTDVATAVNTVGVLMKTKLAANSTEAFDLITAASQKVPAALREDLMASIDEYGKHFSDLGFSGEQAMGILVKGAEGGAVVLDKIGDSLKEFTLLSTDMSESSQAAYEAIGLNAKEMAGEILKGGDSSAKATQKIAKGLLSIKDPVERANQSIALFGTPLEDLSVQQIPDFLRSLSEAPPALAGVEGATKRMGDTLNDNGQARIDAFRNRIQMMTMTAASADGPLGTAAAGAAAFGGTALTGASQLGVMVMAMRGTGAAAGIMSGASAVASMGLRGVGIAVRFALGPIGLIITGVALVAAGLIYAYRHSSRFRAIVDTGMRIAGMAFKWFLGKAQQVFGWLRSNWPLIKGILFGPIGIAVALIRSKFGSLSGFVRTMKSKISGAARGMWSGIVSEFKGAINSIIGGWNRLSFGIPGFSAGPIEYGGFQMSPPQIPYLAKGGIVSRPTLAMIGEGREKEAVLPLSKLEGIISSGSINGRNRRGGGPWEGAPGRRVSLGIPGARRAGSGEAPNIRVTSGGGSALERVFIEMIRRFVRVNAQGDVQVAFGRG